MLIDGEINKMRVLITQWKWEYFQFKTHQSAIINKTFAVEEQITFTGHHILQPFLAYLLIIAIEPDNNF